jgi:thioesterase domain-containing protein/acyl carrier protein
MTNETSTASGKERRHQNIWNAVGNLVGFQASAPPLLPIERNGTTPLSYAQERLWLLCRTQQTSAYNVPLVWRISGELDLDALAASLHEIAQRHEVLRTFFPSVEGRPVAVVGGTNATPLVRVSLFGGSLDTALAAARDEIRKPFDLTTGPLLRATLFTCSPMEHVLALAIHQIVFDGASMRLLSFELSELYRALAGKSGPALPKLTVQYSDFAHWQHELLQGGVLEKETAFWRATLETGYSPFHLRCAANSTAIIGPAEKVKRTVSGAVSEGLRKLAKAEEATKFTVLVAALQALIHRYSEAEDIILFTSCSARSRHEVRNLIGLFANILPLRTSLQGVSTFRELLRRAASSTLDAFAHQTLPLANTMELLHMNGELSSATVFQAMLIYQSMPLPELEFPAARFTPLEVDIGVARFHLLFELTDTKGAMHCSLKYRSDILDEGSATRLLDDFQTLLGMVAENPDVALSDLPVSQEASSAGISAPDRKIQQPSRKSIYAHPRDAMELRLVRLWEELLGVQRIGVHDTFFELGGHSLAVVRMFAEIERIFGPRLPLAALLQAPTIAGLARVIRRGSIDLPWSSLVPVQTAGQRPPVFLVHGVGGHVLGFGSISHYMGPDQPLYGLQARGIDGGAEPLHKVEDMAAHYIGEMRTVQNCGPYYLGGVSFGGLVAYEMARQLSLSGETVALLVLFDTAPTGLEKTLKWQERLSLAVHGGMIRFRLHASSLFTRHLGQDLAYARAGVIRLGRKLRSWTWRFLYESGKTRSAVQHGPNVVEEAARLAALRYIPQTYSGKAVLLRAEDGLRQRNEDLSLGWNRLIKGGVEIRKVPGDHLSMHVEPHVRRLAGELRSCIDEARARQRDGGAFKVSSAATRQAMY